MTHTRNSHGMDIAIIGMAVRLPGANSLDAYWEAILEGRECTTWFKKEELREEGISPDLLAQPGYIPAKPVISGADRFDAEFFGFSRIEAAMLDPRTRVFHEVAYHALEHAGYADDRSDRRSVGIFAGASEDPEWLRRTTASMPKDGAEQFEHGTLAHKDMLAQLVAYHLDLHGPAYTIYTACSTSLAAVHLAVQSLLFGECDLAIAGGITIDLPIRSGYLPRNGMIHSLDGHCRPFDANAKGTLFGDGAGAVVLKRLRDAQADGDWVHAILRGIAANNDGRRKIGFSAPSHEGQRDLIRTTLAIAEVEPESIGYVETHGTGTPIGDPVEFGALTAAFDTERTGYCALGSVKANIGHTHAAAGVAGLIKAVLTVREGVIPPLTNFSSPNENLELDCSPFYMPAEPLPWPTALQPRRAGVSSFGIGGTNLHAVIEAAADDRSDISVDGAMVFPVSAQSPESLARLTDALLKRLVEIDDRKEITRLARTMQMSRRRFEHRAALIVHPDGETGRHCETITPGTPAAAEETVLCLDLDNRTTPLSAEQMLAWGRRVLSLAPSIQTIGGSGADEWLAAALAGMMSTDAVLAALEEADSGAFPAVPSRQPVSMKVLSWQTGHILRPEQIRDDGYWLERLLSRESTKSPVKPKGTRTVPLPIAGPEANDLARLIATLWIEGEPIRWQALYPDGLPGRTAGPEYPFQPTLFPLPGPVCSPASGMVPPEPDETAATLCAPRPQLSSPYRAPETAAEKQVVKLMSELLGIAPIGLNDDFFELGGHSLLATRLSMKIEDTFSLRLDLATLLEAPCAAAICDQLSRLREVDVKSSRTDEVKT